ncbi:MULTISPECIES: ATPase domain-containing protein [unclassified Aureimonas]|uniref:ATPase domain-containing protein n=1 Tax=unclassified Aureimonas TaxID=2615206 RepID=UPI0006F9777C|nr:MULTISPECIES: ATPase domain-containing protein [unclassified Aureimonas]KQT60706.1 circadian clock protein KaiC [Aureimonas sp. Leaf460]KQT68835.1 circadian clock protein KaiC [Aureimonas sp. Leaf427]
MPETRAISTEGRISTGIPGLDDILGGGFTADRLYLVEGTPGTGKTTLSLQFLLAGVEAGESGLYITLSETAEELRAVAATHGWTLDALSIFELVGEEGLDPDAEQSILHPSEIELGETTKGVMRMVEEMRPRRVVFDSLSELRLLAQNPLRYRRQILTLKQFFASRRCTVLMLDDRTSEANDLQLHSIAHGVISLEQAARDFGSERRRLRVMKMRGIKFRGGYHDFNLDTGGLTVFPRLVAAEHHLAFDASPVSTGNTGLDALLGGGLAPGTNTLLSGPSGVGKTTTAIRCMMAALERGETATYFLFDEGLGTLLSRSTTLGMDIRPFIDSGQLSLQQIDPAELSPGEFTSRVRKAVEEKGSRFLVIDSLNAYLHAMPGEQFLILQMHEILTYLSQQGVTAILVLGQHGLVGDMRSDVDLSYLSDAILLFRFFEAHGEVRTAVSVVKSRTSAHERTIREFRLGQNGLAVGEALHDFEGVLTGLPSYKGIMRMLNDGDTGSRTE